MLKVALGGAVGRVRTIERTLRLEPPPPRHSPQVPHHEPTDAEKLLGFVEAKRAPDALGLARMQHACGDLSNLVAEYEEEIGMAPPPGSSSKKSTVSTGPASFSNCNGQLIELTTRLVGHLKRHAAEQLVASQLPERKAPERKAPGGDDVLAEGIAGAPSAPSA